MGILNWIKKLFTRKKKVLELDFNLLEEIHYKKPHIDRYFDEPKQKRVLRKTITKKPGPIKPDIVISEPVKEEPFVSKVSYVEVEGIKFCMDKNDYLHEYLSDFTNEHGWIISTHNGYLIRHKENNEDNMEFFHRFILIDDIKEFSGTNHISIHDIHVHHKNMNKNDNRRANLQILSRKEHLEIHNRSY